MTGFAWGFWFLNKDWWGSPVPPINLLPRALCTAAVEEVLSSLSLICTEGDGATGLTARTRAGRILSGFQATDSTAVTCHVPAVAWRNTAAGRGLGPRLWDVVAWNIFSRDEGSGCSPLGPEHPIPGGLLSTAVRITTCHTNVAVCKQQSHPCFTAWEVSCSKLCGLGLSLVFQEASRAVKSLMIAPQLFAQWLHFCLCCRLAVWINCLKHTEDKTEIHLPATPLFSPDSAETRRNKQPWVHSPEKPRELVFYWNFHSPDIKTLCEVGACRETALLFMWSIKSFTRSLGCSQKIGKNVAETALHMKTRCLLVLKHPARLKSDAKQCELKPGWFSLGRGKEQAGFLHRTS